MSSHSRLTSKFSNSRPPSPPLLPSDSHFHHHSLGGNEFSFSVPPTPDPTPPPSLPVSPPTSPFDKKLAPNPPRDKSYSTSGTSPTKKSRSSTRSSGFVRVHQVEEEDGLPEAYNFEPRSPILPKVNLAFPTFLSSEGEDDEDYPRVAGAGGGGGEGQRTWSHRTTVKRTEHRTWKYSMPSLELYEDGGVPLGGGSTSSKRGTRYSLPSYSHVPPSSTSTSSSTGRRTPLWTPTSSTTHSRESSNDIPLNNASNRRFFPSFSSAYPLSSNEIPSSTSASNFNPNRNTASRKPSSPSSSTSPTDPLLQPLVNLFFILSIATLTCVSIGTVLVFGFSLTFYDDCSKRFIEGRNIVKGSIEGMKTGVGKIMGGAKEALDLVVRVGVKQVKNVEGVMNRGSGGDHGTRLGGQPPWGRNGNLFQRGRSRTRKRKSSSGSSSSSSPSVGGNRNGNSTTNPKQQPHPHPLGEEWLSEDDGLPSYDYTVPPPTPLHHSRNPSPHRSALPPRPPLIYLIPSILFTLLYTLFRIGKSIWEKKVNPPSAEKDDELDSF